MKSCPLCSILNWDSTIFSVKVDSWMWLDCLSFIYKQLHCHIARRLLFSGRYWSYTTLERTLQNFLSIFITIDWSCFMHSSVFFPPIHLFIYLFIFIIIIILFNVLPVTKLNWWMKLKFSNKNKIYYIFFCYLITQN